MNQLQKFITEIDGADSLIELKILHEKLESQVKEYLKEDCSILQLTDSLSEVHDALVKKALFFAERKAIELAVGERPKRWCWFVMGSMGRREATIWTDQDNGILFDCERENEQGCYEYIEHFAFIGTKYLHAVGYPFCPGNVMATNPRWSNSVRNWRKIINNYLTNHLPDDIRFLLMTVDMRPIYGDIQLVEEEKQRLIDLISQRPIILKRIGEHSVFPKVPLGILGNFLEERYGPYHGQLDLKQSGYIQLINSVKFLSLSEKIMANSTLERVEQLKKHTTLPQLLLENTEQAFINCLYFRLKHAAQFEQHDYHVHLHKLDKKERLKLKKVMKMAKKLQRYVLQRAGGWKDV
jgi:CBS domain-containing protein